MKNELNNELNDNLNFDNKNEFYRWIDKNFPEFNLVSVSKLGEEFVKAEEAGYNGERYENPFRVNSLKYWAAEVCYLQGEQDC